MLPKRTCPGLDDINCTWAKESPCSDLRSSLHNPPPLTQIAYASLHWGFPSRQTVEKWLGEQNRASHLLKGLEQLLQPGNLVLWRKAQSLTSPYPRRAVPSPILAYFPEKTPGQRKLVGKDYSREPRT